MSTPAAPRRWPHWRRWLAGAAGLAGALAPFAGAAPARVDVAALAREVLAETDHLSAVELAAWIAARRPRLRVLDVRSADEYAAFHIPGAEHLPLERIAFSRFAPDETLVLYSEAGAHGAQAWVLLRALGHQRVTFLRRGLHEWLEDVLSPTLPAEASPEAVAAFARVEALSRHFGGAPRRLPPPSSSGTGTGTHVVERPAALRGRGC